MPVKIKSQSRNESKSNSPRSENDLLLRKDLMHIKGKSTSGNCSTSISSDMKLTLACTKLLDLLTPRNTMKNIRGMWLPAF